MHIKYNKLLKNNIVIVELETYNFSPKEIEAMSRFGEPDIVIEKMYPLNSSNPSFPVMINRKIRSNMKIRVKFDGTEDYEKALIAAESFYEDIKTIIQDALEDLMTKMDDSLAYDLGSGIEKIDSGEEGIPPAYHYCCNPSHHVIPPHYHINGNIVFELPADTIHS